MAELTGQTFAGYEILAKLGQGGMGAVYKARQPVLNRIVALKVMSPHLSDDPAFVSRFIREASSAAKLNHANMVLVHTAGQCDGTYYIVMEFVDGLSLQDHIHNHGRLDAHEAIAAAVDELTHDRSAMLLEQANRGAYRMLKEGIPVSVADTGNSTPHRGPLPNAIGISDEFGFERLGWRLIHPNHPVFDTVLRSCSCKKT